MGELDIAIAGCGIAGLASALLLHRDGHRVTLYERFEAPRPLGSGLMLQPTGMAVLAHLGLAEATVARGAQVTQLYGRNAEGSVVLDARYGDMRLPGAFGLGIHRASLFEVLLEAVAASGIAIQTGREVDGTELAGSGRRLTFGNADPSPVHDLVVDTSGVASPLAPYTEAWLPYGALWTSLPWPEGGPFHGDRLEQRYERAHRMAGVLPTGTRQRGKAAELAFFWSLRADAHAAWQDAGLAAWKDEVARLWPECEALVAQIDDPGSLTFARYAHRQAPSPVAERLVHIGDAWHSASPQLGQGANMALLDAFALARGLAQDGPLQARLDHAIALRRSHVRLYQALTRIFTPLYQSDAILPAVLRDALLAPLGRVGPGPRIQGALVGGLSGDPLGRLGLYLPDYTALRR